MQASELIAKLQELVKTHGDCEIACHDFNGCNALAKYCDADNIDHLKPYEKVFFIE